MFLVQWGADRCWDLSWWDLALWSEPSYDVDKLINKWWICTDISIFLSLSLSPRPKCRLIDWWCNQEGCAAVAAFASPQRLTEEWNLSSSTPWIYLILNLFNTVEFCFRNTQWTNHKHSRHTDLYILLMSYVCMLPPVVLYVCLMAGWIGGWV